MESNPFKNNTKNSFASKVSALNISFSKRLNEILSEVARKL